MRANHPIRKLLTKLGIAAASASLLASCAASLPETEVYTLSTFSPPQASSSEPLQISAGVGPLIFPDKLKRPQIVTRINDNQLRLSEQHHWGGYLEREFLTTLVQNVSINLKDSSIQPYPWDNRRKPRYQIQVQVYRFDGELGSDSVLEVSWSIVDQSGAKELLQTNKIYREVSEDATYGSMVAALSRAMARLSTDIANQLRTLEQKIQAIKKAG